MRILYLSPRRCWPPTSGAKLRDYYLQRALAAHCDLTCIYFSEQSPVVEEPPLPAEMMAVSKPRAYSLSKILRGIFSRDPLSVINYRSTAFSRAVAGITVRTRFDLVHIDSPHMGQYAAMVDRRTPIVFSWHNIESEILLRYAAETPSALRRHYARLTAQRLARVEHGMLARGFGQLVCSQRERRQLLSIAPDSRIEVIENGVDTAGFSPVPSPGRKRILYVGQMSYHANQAAVEWFARNVWPALAGKVAPLQLTIVGSDPGPKVRALASLPGIEVTGTVPDVRPYYADAAMVIVPLRTGSGTRLKILEAMAAGVPVVSTAMGAEGLETTPGENILICETASEWVETCAALAADAPLASRLAGGARRLVETRYDWTAIGRKLVATYERWFPQTDTAV